MKDEAIACRVCGGSKGARFHAGGDGYSRCVACHTVQKILTEKEYRALDPGYDPGLYLMGAGEEELRRFLEVDEKRRVLRDITRKIGRGPEGLSLLDVGSGMGGYLVAGRDLGMEVEGFEPSHSHSTIARAVLNLEVRPHYFTKDKVEGRRFDIIMLSHVIEHIYEPGPFLAELVSVLKPGGALKLLTPNADSLSAKAVGAAWPMLVPIDHVTLLTPRSFAYLVPEGCSLRISTSEYRYEFASTIGSAIKSKLRGRQRNVSRQPAAVSAKLLNRADWRSRMVRSALSLASAPFRAYALGRGRGSCLNALIVRK